jgi:CheY-like chemotaxis protein
MSRPTILVCDDDPGLRLLLRLTVEPRGYRIVDARDGSSCIELTERLHPDLVLIDAQLPDMSVEAVIGAIRGDPRSRTIPLLVAASSAFEHERDPVDIDGVLVKPFPLERLIEEIERLLASREQPHDGVPLRRLR